MAPTAGRSGQRGDVVGQSRHLAETILLTGAGGFVGRAAARHFAEAGYRVRAVSRDPAKLAATFSDARLLPANDAPAADWAALLGGVTHVVHAAGLAHASAAMPSSAYMQANADLTGALARAADRFTPGRFVFLSSIRAVCGPVADTIVRDGDPEAPEDDYGRSKLEGERRVAMVFAASGRHVILRPTLVYGPGVKGNFRLLSRLAALPLPLPIAGLSARRSLLDVDALAQAILVALRTPAGASGPYLVCDRRAVSVPEIVAAIRDGLGRSPMLYRVPTPLLDLAANALLGRERWRRLSGPLVADPTGFSALGWQPAADSMTRIARLARAQRDNVT
jgi:nucleoside-diphosphate-sugar epimerase